jgi:uncharacterized protein
MKSTVRVILVCLLGVACVMPTVAQKKTPGKQADKIILQSGIRVIAKAYGDSIVLRWAPARSWAWFKLNAIGYKIQRIDVSEKDNPKTEWLTPTPLKPFTLEKLKTTFGAGNTHAAIAAQCLYGKNFDTHLRPGQAGIADKSNVTDARYAFALQSADFDGGVATAIALRYADKNVKKGGTYIYRVVPAASATQGTIDTGNTLIINTVTAVAATPVIKESLAFDRLVELHWDRTGADTWSGYYIERSEDGRNFKQLNTLPFITSRPDSALLKQDTTKARLFGMLQTQHIFIDSLPQNYRAYTYRIRGINAFAELSTYSNSSTLSGRDLTAPVAVSMLNPTYVSGQKIKVLWKKDVIEKDCKGYYISRAHTVNGPYETLNEQLLPAAATEFTDEHAFAHGGSFYMVIAVDTANNISSSVPAMGLVPDVTAPAVPTGLKGIIGRNGLVTLNWIANKEDDIKGYKVYFANAPDHVFTQITSGPDSLTRFVDSITLKTLTKNIWYKIVAVDYNNNHSDYSPPVQLRKPDIVPPAPPLASNIIVSDKGVEMDWIQSSSEDVVSYVIYRRQDNNERTMIAKYKHNTSVAGFHFKDTTLKPNLSYNYIAEAIDEDSLRNPSLPVQVKINTVPQRPAITTLKAVYDSKAKAVQLNWQYTATGDYFFVLYRSADKEPMQRWQSVNKEENKFADHTVSAGKSYRYAIQAVHRDANGNTTSGAPVEVMIKNE